MVRISGVLHHNIVKPLHSQLHDIIVEKIDSGDLKAGDVLPGERALADEFDISRVTVRKSIGRLMEEGYVSRRHGKGTIVSNRDKEPNRGKLMGAIEELRRLYADELVVVSLHKGIVAPSKETIEELNLPDNLHKQAYMFSRLMLRNNQAAAINYSYTSEDFGSIIDALDLTKDIVLPYLENCGFSISYGEQQMFAQACSEELSAELQCKPGVPVMVVCRTIFLENGEAVIWEKTVHIDSDYQFKMRLSR